MERSENFESMRKRFLVPENPYLPIFRAIIATVKKFEIPKFYAGSTPTPRNLLSSLSFLQAKNWT